jgi:LPS export ABC transporter protein LptC
MRRRTLWALLVVVLLVGSAAAWRWQAGVRKALESAISGGVTDSATLEEAVGVAMKGIELVQGEKGIELWRLKATWAQLRQSNNVIDVDSPDLVYQMDGGRQLRIVAQKGEVQQQVQLVRMWDDVHATHDRHELFSSLMVYNGTSRTMYFPEGARIEGQSLSGNATRLEWDVAADVLRGSDGVSLLLMPRADDKNGQGAAQPKAAVAAPRKADAAGKSPQAHPAPGQAARKPSGQTPSGQTPKAAKVAPQGVSKPTKQESKQ